MSEPQKKKELSGELRILIASLLSMAVIVLWVKFFAPKAPINPPQSGKAVQTAPTPTSPATSTPPSGNSSQLPPSTSGTIAPTNPPSVAAKADTQERTIVVENDLYRVEISNRGGVVRSWELKKYMDDAKPPHVLDLVHAKTADYLGGWPLALAIDDPQMQTLANSGLYRVSLPQPEYRKADSTQTPETLPPNPLKAPAELQFAWSDGHLEVTKKIHFDESYVVHVETSVRFNGARINAGLAWLGGFGDLTVQNPAPVETVFTFYSQNGSLTSLPYKKLDGSEKWGPGTPMRSRMISLQTLLSRSRVLWRYPKYRFQVMH